jgi:hypothetical protein
VLRIVSLSIYKKYWSVGPCRGMAYSQPICCGVSMLFIYMVLL